MKNHNQIMSSHTNTIESKINSLKNSGSIIISENKDNGINVVAERSGDGKTLTIVRNFPDGSFEVISRKRF